MSVVRSRWLLAGVGLIAASAAKAQTTLPATQFVLKSTGAASGSDYNLWSNGYVGTFLKLQKAATVTLQIQAAGAEALNVWPTMGLHVGNQQFTFTADSTTFSTFTAKVNLPAGTTLVRIEFLNDYYDSGSGQDRNLFLRDLTVTAGADAGLQFVNPASSADLKAVVFNAADTTIEAYRKQDATVTFVDAKGTPLPKGTAIHAQLSRHAFNFGTAVPGFGDPWDIMWPKPEAHSNAAKFQTMLVKDFNLIEEENAGKWYWTEPERNKPQMAYVDAILQFAKKNGMRVRQHNLLWGQAQPDWAVALENTAQGSDARAAKIARADLQKAITYRTGYVVHDRALGYQELDGINEAYAGHQGVFYNIFGYEGIANIYNKAIAQIRSIGSPAKVYFNEYDVINNGDAYGNWYLNFIQNVIDSGISAGNRSKLGIGIQYYNLGSVNHDAVRIYQTLANLGTLGLPISLTEFGLDGGNANSAPQVLGETLWLIFGMDQATTFNTWGFWESYMWQTGAAFYKSDWTITPTGKVWQQMTGRKDWKLKGVPHWTTDVTLTTDSKGAVVFRGFAGDYTLAIGAKSVPLTLALGTKKYTMTIPN
jgi:endo-1,4-beta-xylanase